MKKIILVGAISLLFGCDASADIDDLKNKLYNGVALSEKNQCYADTIVSSAIDPKNTLAYAAAFDTLTRVFIVKDAELTNYCRSMIPLVKSDDYQEDIVERCPKEYFSLTDEQMTSLDNRSHILASKAANFDGGLLDFVMGSCNQ